MAIKHTEEFKREAVHIALSSGLPQRQVAADLGDGLSTLGKWVSQRRPDDRRTGHDDDLARENERLRRENRVLLDEKADFDDKQMKEAFYRQFNRLEEGDKVRIREMIEAWGKKK